MSILSMLNFQCKTNWTAHSLIKGIKLQKTLQIAMSLVIVGHLKGKVPHRGLCNVLNKQPPWEDIYSPSNVLQLYKTNLTSLTLEWGKTIKSTRRTKNLSRLWFAIISHKTFFVCKTKIWYLSNIILNFLSCLNKTKMDLSQQVLKPGQYTVVQAQSILICSGTTLNNHTVKIFCLILI